MTKKTILEDINKVRIKIEKLIKLIKEKSETMNSITQSATASQVLDIDSRRNKRLSIGRTSDELHEYLDKFFPSLTRDNKRDLVQTVMKRESSFTHLEEMVFKLYH
jgi:hypothetical protein